MTAISRKARRIARDPAKLLDADTRRWLRRTHWLLPVALAAWAWWRLGKPGGSDGLAAATGIMIALWPLAVLWCWYGLPAMIRAMWPREWRARHRKRRADAWRAAHPAEVAKGQGPPRPPVPARLERLTFAAYRHRCVSCGTRDGLQWEHIQPWGRGGLHSLWNGTVLCGGENNLKSDYWVYRGGRVYYRHSFGGGTPEQRAAAATILRRERRARLNLLRWLLVAWLITIT